VIFMAFRRKNADFRPDSQRQDWTQRLYLSPQQQRRYLKWALLSLLSVVALVLQDVLFARMSLFGATVDMVPTVLFMICVIHGAESGAVFMLVGALIYWFSGSAPGVYVILLIPVLGTVAAAFRQAYLRKGFRTTLMCTAAALVAYETVSFLASLLLGVTRFGRAYVMVISTVLSLLTLPAVFLLVWGICKIGGDSWKE
jgi:hypothetical protein